MLYYGISLDSVDSHYKAEDSCFQKSKNCRSTAGKEIKYRYH